MQVHECYPEPGRLTPTACVPEGVPQLACLRAAPALVRPPTPHLWIQLVQVLLQLPQGSRPCLWSQS